MKFIVVLLVCALASGCVRQIPPCAPGEPVSYVTRAVPIGNMLYMRTDPTCAIVAAAKEVPDAAARE